MGNCEEFGSCGDIFCPYRPGYNLSLHNVTSLTSFFQPLGFISQISTESPHPVIMPPMVPHTVPPPCRPHTVSASSQILFSQPISRHTRRSASNCSGL
ncbi:hypothetical protein GDO78_014837 [Eleutherodactylus coqui]|uniref:Uncharacterized protein n=1 Tax=Eleutherodactylus coqui TaxID=57060 RepID=A0A8J6BFA7_ELECQ|nr:hypothetical protein GDO78_014837 [Eleutherodactylus coqui]